MTVRKSLQAKKNAVGTSLDSLPPDVIVQVAGPDPYTARRWFASIKSGPKVS